MSKKVANIFTKDKDGNISKSSVIRGMSAYESAKVGGYDKSEEEFYRELSDLATNEKVADVQTELEEKVSQLSEEIVNIVIDDGGSGENHNILPLAPLTETTKNGLTYSIVDDVITINGTATAVGDFPISNAMFEDGQYQVAMEAISGSISNPNTSTWLYQSNAGVPLNPYSPIVSTYNANVVGMNRNKFGYKQGQVFENYKFHVWVNKGDTIYPYEKYGEAVEGGKKLNEDIKIERVDTHIVDEDIHVSKAEKDAWNGLVAIDEFDFTDEINDTVAKVLEHNTDKCLNFALLTDSHVDLGNESSVRQYNTTIEHIKALNNRLPLDGVIHLGDFVNTQWLWQNSSMSDSDYQNVVSTLANRLKLSGADNIYIASGNHDGGYLGNKAEYFSYPVNYKNVQSFVDSKNRGKIVRVTDSNGFIAPYYYVDYSDMKTRCIYLCTDVHSTNAENKGIHYAQAWWLGSVLADMPKDYNVLMFGHIPFSIFNTAMGKSYASTAEVKEIVSAFNSHSNYAFSGSVNMDYTSHSGKVLAYFCGHYHGDRVIPTTDEKSVIDMTEIVTCASGYLSSGIITSGDYYDNADSPSRQLGTLTEDAFDIVTYSPKDGKIYLTRFGAGEDREITLA